jgi:hypothetical protein
MSEPTDDHVIQLLRSALSQDPVSPMGDLWPRVRHRVEEAPGRPLIADYLLAAAAVTVCLLQPSLITLLLLMF